jgi:hypothetical protein
MLVFLWMCVATAAFVPHGDRVVTYYTAAMEDYFDTMLGEPARGAEPARRVRASRIA